MPNVIIPAGGGGPIQPSLVTEYVNPAAPDSGIIYVSQGERWDSIAWKMYGDSTLINALIQNNPGIAIQDTVDAGVQVFVPLIAPVINSTPLSPFG
jgi:phage tail protein X